MTNILQKAIAALEQAKGAGTGLGVVLAELVENERVRLQGNMDLRDYNRRCADALDAALYAATSPPSDNQKLREALKGAALGYGPNGSGGMRVVADFTSPEEAMPLFDLLSDAAMEEAPECFQCGEVYGENPQCPVHGRAAHEQKGEGQ